MRQEQTRISAKAAVRARTFPLGRVSKKLREELCEDSIAEPRNEDVRGLHWDHKVVIEPNEWEDFLKENMGVLTGERRIVTPMEPLKWLDE
jgi:hypothetical protein